MAKVKTSVSISSQTLARVKEIAKREDRSVSYVLEKLIESIVRETPDPPFMHAVQRPHITYSQNKRRSLKDGPSK